MLTATINPNEHNSYFPPPPPPPKKKKKFVRRAFIYDDY